MSFSNFTDKLMSVIAPIKEMYETTISIGLIVYWLNLLKTNSKNPNFKLDKNYLMQLETGPRSLISNMKIIFFQRNCHIG